MIPNNVAEQLLQRLVAKAKDRHAQGLEDHPGLDFDKFLAAVQKVGELSVQLTKEGMDFNHVGMALDYYSRAIKYMIAEAAKLESAPVGGHA